MSQYVGQNVDGTYGKPFDWSKIDWGKHAMDDFGMGMPNKTTQTKVLCKDGTFGFDISSPNAKYDNSKTCINNGGRAVNQLPIDVKPTSETVKQQNLLGGGRTLTTEDKFYEMLGIKKTDGTGWGLQSRPMGRILVAVVLVAGYFAYKKFKK